MSALLFASSVDSVAGLAGLLPPDVRERLDPEAMAEPPTAAALRVLATIRDERWRDYVGQFRINWDGLLAWSRTGATPSVRVRIELAASPAGCGEARASLLAGAAVLDEGNFEALLDALRIAREGLVP